MFVACDGSQKDTFQLTIKTYFLTRKSNYRRGCMEPGELLVLRGAGRGWMTNCQRMIKVGDWYLN